MNLWRAFQKWRNKTADWVEDPLVPLTLDLDRGRFCGVALGEPLGRFTFLGRAQLRGFDLLYPDEGLEIGDDEGVLREVVAFFGHPEEPDAGYFRGDIFHQGERITSQALRTESMILARAGEPYWRHEASDESILFYERPGFEFQFELGSDGILKAIVLSEPILADAEQRDSYGVTKNWPPAEN